VLAVYALPCQPKSDRGQWGSGSIMNESTALCIFINGIDGATEFEMHFAWMRGRSRSRPLVKRRHEKCRKNC